MKKIITIITLAAVLWSCGSTVPSDEAGKRKQLQKLKQDLHTIEQQIATLEAELDSGPKEEVIRIKVNELSQQKFEHFIEVTGNVEAELDVDVSPEASGVIKEVLVVEGQMVKKGQVMARLNTDLLERSVEELEVQYDLAKTNYERQKNLWDQNIGSEMQYLQAKNNKESLEKRITSLKTQIKMGEIKAPTDGVVDNVYQKKGHIGSPQLPFAKVINIGKIKVYGEISESYITKIQNGDKVSVYFPALERNIEASINQISNTVDPNNRTFRIRINLDNTDEMIKPNLLAILTLRDYVNEEAIVVPALFIKEDFNGHYTYIAEKEGAKNVAKKVYVEPGVTNNNMTEVINGLSAGMKVISQGYNQIANGTQVEIN